MNYHDIAPNGLNQNVTDSFQTTNCRDGFGLPCLCIDHIFLYRLGTLVLHLQSRI